MAIVLILAGAAVVAAIAVVPLLLPWPQYVRRLLAGTAVPDPDAMSLTACPLTICEVRVGDVSPMADGSLVEIVDASSSRTPRWYVLPGDATDRVATARLARWSAAHATLFLVADADGACSLHGPAHAVVGLRPSPTRDDSAVRGPLAIPSSDHDHGSKRHWLVSR